MSSILPPAVLDYLAAYQSGNTSRLPIRLAMKVENNRIVKLFENS
jgi:hypothetical protein